MRIRLNPIACQSIVLAVCLGMPMPLIASLANHANALPQAEATTTNPATAATAATADAAPAPVLGSAIFDTRVMTTGSIVGW
jgi:hypothetical protein